MGELPKNARKPISFLKPIALVSCPIRNTFHQPPLYMKNIQTFALDAVEMNLVQGGNASRLIATTARRSPKYPIPPPAFPTFGDDVVSIPRLRPPVVINDDGFKPAS